MHMRVTPAHLQPSRPLTHLLPLAILRAPSAEILPILVVLVLLARSWSLHPAIGGREQMPSNVGLDLAAFLRGRGKWWAEAK